MKPDSTIIDAIRDAENPKQLCNALHSLASAIGTGKIHYSAIRTGVSRAVDEPNAGSVSLKLILPPAPPQEQS